MERISLSPARSMSVSLLVDQSWYGLVLNFISDDVPHCVAGFALDLYRIYEQYMQFGSRI